MKKIIYIIVYALLLMLMLAAQLMLVWDIYALDMVPDLYLAVLICLVVLLTTGTAVLLFVHKRGQWIGVARQIIACVLIVLTVGACLYVAPKIQKFQSTVQTITTNTPAGAFWNVYVKNEDPAQTIQDAADYTFAALELDENCTQQAIEAIEKELGTSIAVQYFDNESLMASAYENGEAQALILNEGYLSIWNENEFYTQFEMRNRVLYTAPVVESDGVHSPGEVVAPETEPVADITNTPFIFYISGMDGDSKLLARTRSDVNILMVVNPATKQILMINTPRDYYIVHPWGSGSRDKLTHCGVYGIDCSISALENLYETTVNYYLQINFTGFESLIDSIGGITVHSDRSFYCGGSEEVYIPKGDVHLDGKSALAFARDRYHQAGGDNDRGKNQMKVIKSVINKATSGRTLIANYTSILSSLEGMLATNIPMDDISKLVKMQLTDMASWNIMSYSVTGYGDTRTTYSMPGTGAYVMHPHEYTVNYAKSLIQRVVNGEALTQADMTAPKPE